MSVMTLLIIVLAGHSASAAETAKVTFRVTAPDGKPMPCRIHLADAAGKPVRAPHRPFFRDHFVIPGTTTLPLADGEYSFTVERGPEFERKSGTLHIKNGIAKTIAVPMKRIADLAARGWFSGELHVHRPVDDIQLLMQAEDLHVAPVITWWNNHNIWKDRAGIPKKTVRQFDGDRFFSVMAGEDEREGGALMYYGLKRPLAITGSSREFPSPLKFVSEARKHKNVWIDIEKPFWWDVPVWLASGQANSIGLANNHMCRSRMYESEAWGRPRDVKRLPSPRGNGFWTQEIYYHILNCGIRIPPSAGSASGVLPNPVGYNRVYVHTGKPLTYAKWWQGLKAGRSFVTNGPLLLAKANGKLPGEVFRTKAGRNITLQLNVELKSNDHVPAIEVVKNGVVVRAMPTKTVLKTGSLGSLTFQSSGWFLIRAIAANKRTFRFASTAPFYVEVGENKKRISKRSVRFFQKWVDERIARVPAKLKDAAKLKAVLEHHQQAKEFWAGLAKAANAE